MGLTETPGSARPVAAPTIEASRPQWRAPAPQSPAPSGDRDWRTEEIRQLRAAICRWPPTHDDAYWESNRVWVGCTDAYLDKTAGTGDFVRLVIKAQTRHESGDIWDYYESRKDEIIAEVRRQFPSGNIRIVDTKVEKGSVTILVLIQITIGLGLLIVAILSNYDTIERNFKRAMPLIQQYVTDTLSALKRFFGGFGFGAT